MVVNRVNGPRGGGVGFLLRWRRVQVGLGKVFQTKMGPRKVGAECQRKLRWDIRETLSIPLKR